MRPIKFRAWDKKLKEMIDFNDNGIDTYLLSIYSEGWQIEFDNSEDDKRYFGKERFILMQFTGLLDKQGKEIYEGNIATYTNAKATFIGTIKYIEEYTAFRLVFEDGRWTDLAECIEVIGNIYQNPELLK